MRRMRLWLLTTLVVILVLTSAIVYADKNVSIFIDGVSVECDSTPFIKDGRVFAPIRPICEKMGADVSWDDATKSVYIRGVPSINQIERDEYFIDTDTGMRLYTVEKRLASTRPSKAVLLIHGSGVGYGYYDIPIGDYSMADYLARKGFYVFMVDQRGYGRSTKPDGLSVTAEQSAADLKSVVDFIKRKAQIEKVDLVGHSWGGAVAAVLAGKYQGDIGRVVLIGFPYKKVHAQFQPAVEMVANLAKSGQAYFSNPNPMQVRAMMYGYEEKVVDWYANLVAQVYGTVPTGLSLDLESFEYSKYIPQITSPTLLINGLLEDVVDQEDTIQCLNDLTMSEKGFLMVGNARHLVMLEKNAYASLNNAVASWLQQ